MTFSDHHPITMVLMLNLPPALYKIWRYNPSLLKDPVYYTEVKMALVDYFALNDTVDTTPLTQWEAHKGVIRGKLTSLAAAQKKKSQKIVRDLVSKIKNLETCHKASLHTKTLQDLLQAHTELQEIFPVCIHRHILLSPKLLYEFGNKSSRLLTRVLGTKTFVLRMHNISDNDGKHSRCI